MSTLKQQFIMVDDNGGLDELNQALAKTHYLAIDTEYDSFRYFRERLCLIQLATASGCFLIDPFCGRNCLALGQPLADPNVVVIFHAGENDVRLLKRDYGFVITEVFDVQIAAKLLQSPRLDLDSIITHFLGLSVEKKKSMQRSRWERRPLSEEQLKYAYEDVVHLADVVEKQRILLDKKGLVEQSRKMSAGIAAVEWHEKRMKKSDFGRVKKNADLDFSQSELLKKLLKWRFRIAKKRNRALFMVIADDKLLQIAQKRPQSVEEFRHLGILNEYAFRNYHKDILALSTTL